MTNATNNTTTTVATVVYTSKREHAAALYMSQLSNPTDVKSCTMRRKDGIQMFMDQCGMTAAGAGTYWANFHAGIWALEGAKTKQAGYTRPVTTTSSATVQAQKEQMAKIIADEVERQVAARMAALQQPQISEPTADTPKIILLS